MNEESQNQTSILNSRSQMLSPSDFDFFSKQQSLSWRESIEDIMLKIESVKSTKRLLSTTRRLQKKSEKEKEMRWHRLLMSKPTKHSNKWCSSTHLSSDLAKKLTAPVDVDATGCIYSPLRDLPRTKEGQAKLARESLPSFKPGEIGKIFGEPPLDSCTESFREMLERHLVNTLDRVEQEYESMPWGTVSFSELKGGVGRDRAALADRLEKVKANLAKSKTKQPPRTLRPISRSQEPRSQGPDTFDPFGNASPPVAFSTDPAQDDDQPPPPDRD